jgi:VanZ family protein
LSAREIVDNRAAQAGSAGSTLAVFNFAKSLDGTIKSGREAAKASSMLGMMLPQRAARFARAAFLFYDGRFTVSGLDVWDLVRNVILFLPFGLLGPAFLDRWTRTSRWSAFLIVAAAAVVSVGCETPQFFEWERTSSVLDIVTNLAGAVLGTVITRQLTSYAAAWQLLKSS